MAVLSPILISAGNPGPMTGSGNNTWLLPGLHPTLIDAGVGESAHIEEVASRLGGQSLDRVLVTHGHLDHSSGAPALKARWPAVELMKIVRGDAATWSPLADGQVVQAGDSTLTALYTPGHAIDHACFWNPSTRELFAGDMLSLSTTVMIPAGRGGGLRAYLSSLQRMASLGPARVYPGHGPIIDRPIELIEQYLAHRRMREDQVRECLAAGIVDPASIVERIYPQLAPALLAAARATVEAHIEKLREDES